LREELLADPKEQAELVMIVDLERNDLGRVCEPGSVEVVEHARLRSFAHWHHLESKIQGRLRAGVGWSALLAALFPGGSVTGAPKRRAMQIIDEIEAEPRGFYTGALGWLRSRRDADFALTIRTAVIDSSGLEYWTGGGIVADSDPQTEFEETQVKALAMRAALHGK
jgi:anthranilate/para-aminobenzoate synthase component I